MEGEPDVVGELLVIIGGAAVSTIVGVGLFFLLGWLCA